MADPDKFSDSAPSDLYASFAIIPEDPKDPSKGYKLRMKCDTYPDAYLMSNRKNPKFWTKLIYSSTKKEADLEADKCVWKF